MHLRFACFALVKKQSTTKYLQLILAVTLSACANNERDITLKLSGHKTNASQNVDLVCNTPQHYANQVIGDGHCVSLIKECANAPSTSQWRAGNFVLNFKGQLPLGTIIATFKNGRYPNRKGHHAAIYISHDDSGIWVWDQWVGKAVHQRFIRFRNDNANASNTAQEYRVVKLSKNEYQH